MVCNLPVCCRGALPLYQHSALAGRHGLKTSERETSPENKHQEWILPVTHLTPYQLWFDNDFRWVKNTCSTIQTNWSEISIARKKICNFASANLGGTSVRSFFSGSISNQGQRSSRYCPYRAPRPHPPEYWRGTAVSKRRTVGDKPTKGTPYLSYI